MGASIAIAVSGCASAGFGGRLAEVQAPVPATEIARPPVDLAALVDPGVGVRGGLQGSGDTIIGPSLPHGSIHPSPQTLSGSNAGYDPDLPISGFSQLHAQGTGGVTSYGNFLVSPQTGPVSAIEADHLSPKADERPSAESYSVHLDRYGIDAAVAPAQDAAIYRFTYPEGSDASIVFDITRKIFGLTGSAGSDVSIDPTTGRVTGRVKATGHWIPEDFDLWFVAEPDQVPSAWGVFRDGIYQPGITALDATEGQPLAAWISFAPGGARTVTLRVAVSFVSAERAARHLRMEVAGRTFEEVQADARSAWDQSLSRIRVEGASEADTRRFYTALYHASIQPRDRTADHVEAGAPFWDDHYTLWDTYRTLFPLMVLTEPILAAQNINSFIRAFEQQGAAETAYIAGRNYRVGQGGDEVDNVLAHAYVAGLQGVDWERAYRLMVFNAEHRRSDRYRSEGYFGVGDPSPEPAHSRARSGSSTLGFAFNDFSISLVAEGLGHDVDAQRYRARSGSWRNVWDPAAESEGFTGFVRPRRPEGGFQDLDPKQGWDGYRYENIGFYEGTSWIYSYSVPQDVPGLIDAMGGTARFTERLEFALSANLIDFTNEPSFATPWLFHQVCRPDLTSYWADQAYRRFGPQTYPGDDDSGAMSSHYVWNTIGLFPLVSQGRYAIHGGRFPAVEIRVGPDRTFRIERRPVDGGGIYVQSASLNGFRLASPWLEHAEIVKGGVLRIDMGPRPTPSAFSDCDPAGLSR